MNISELPPNNTIYFQTEKERFCIRTPKHKLWKSGICKAHSFQLHGSYILNPVAVKLHFHY